MINFLNQYWGYIYLFLGSFLYFSSCWSKSTFEGAKKEHRDIIKNSKVRQVLGGMLMFIVCVAIFPLIIMLGISDYFHNRKL